MALPRKYYEKNEDIAEVSLVGGYVHGNEPSHHIPYLYAWTSQPWKTQYWVREVMNRMYKNDIDGLGAMTIAGRCLPGICLRQWDSIPFVRVPINTCWEHLIFHTSV